MENLVAVTKVAWHGGLQSLRKGKTDGGLLGGEHLWKNCGVEKRWRRPPYLVKVEGRPPRKGKTLKMKEWSEDARPADGAESGAADSGTTKNDTSNIPLCLLWGEM